MDEIGNFEPEGGSEYQVTGGKSYVPRTGLTRAWTPVARQPQFPQRRARAVDNQRMNRKLLERMVGGRQLGLSQISLD